MSHVDYVDFQDRIQPLAFLVTFRCYGTWLHGEKRGSIDRQKYNRYGTRAMPANQRLLEQEKAELKHEAMVLNLVQREFIELGAPRSM